MRESDHTDSKGLVPGGGYLHLSQFGLGGILILHQKPAH